MTHLLQSSCVSLILCVKSESCFSDRQLRKHISFVTKRVKDKATKNNDDCQDHEQKDRQTGSEVSNNHFTSVRALGTGPDIVFLATRG
jgi:hypothetical protein